MWAVATNNKLAVKALVEAGANKQLKNNVSTMYVCASNPTIKCH
jgi:hypothetical protein